MFVLLMHGADHLGGADDKNLLPHRSVDHPMVREGVPTATDGRALRLWRKEAKETNGGRAASPGTPLRTARAVVRAVSHLAAAHLERDPAGVGAEPLFGPG